MGHLKLVDAGFLKTLEARLAEKLKRQGGLADSELIKGPKITALKEHHGDACTECGDSVLEREKAWSFRPSLEAVFCSKDCALLWRDMLCER